MTEIDPHGPAALTGAWSGFGFQGGHMYTPEGHSLEPGDMAWWSLTCNIAREWRLMMDEARVSPATSSISAPKPLRPKDSTVIHLRDAIRARRERRSASKIPGPDAEPSNVVHLRRGPRPRQRG